MPKRSITFLLEFLALASMWAVIWLYAVVLGA